MTYNGKPADVMSAVMLAKKERVVRDKNFKEQKERLRIKILVHWKQGCSSGFWTKCFKVVPFEVLKNTYDYIAKIKKGGYPVYNEAGMFVSILKKLGHVPLKEVKNV